jgi:hypothetical protein
LVKALPLFLEEVIGKMSNVQKLKQDYPWIQTPLVVGAPMRLIALADMAVEISKAGTHT